MAKKSAKQRVSGPEMNILRILWDQPDLSLSEAHQAMQQMGEKIGYTTVQTRLERLVEKGLVKKSTGRPARYQAKMKPEDVSGPMLDLLLQRVTGAVPLFAQLIQDPSLSAEDLQEMKRLIAEAEERLDAYDGEDGRNKEVER